MCSIAVKVKIGLLLQQLYSRNTATKINEKIYCFMALCPFIIGSSLFLNQLKTLAKRRFIVVVSKTYTSAVLLTN